jgi:hypothetical protein
MIGGPLSPVVVVSSPEEDVTGGGVVVVPSVLDVCGGCGVSVSLAGGVLMVVESPPSESSPIVGGSEHARAGRESASARRDNRRT